jgi:tetratricopeptide (TPR) repeat protein
MAGFGKMVAKARLLFLMLALLVTSPAMADDLKDCKSTNIDLTIRGCSAVIDAGTTTPINMVAAFSNLGIAYRNKGDFDRAIDNFDRAISLNPNDDPTVYDNRGYAYYGKGDFDAAIMDYDFAIELNPRFVNAYFNRGIARSRKGVFDESIADFDKVIALNPKFVPAYYERGEAYVGMGKYKNGLSDFQLALTKIPPSDSMIGKLRKRIAEIEHTARPLSRKNASPVNPNDVDGWKECESTEFATRIKGCSTIIDNVNHQENDDNLAIAHYNRGTAYEKTANYVRAISDFARAIELNSGNLQKQEAARLASVGAVFALQKMNMLTEPQTPQEPASWQTPKQSTAELIMEFKGASDDIAYNGYFGCLMSSAYYLLTYRTATLNEAEKVAYAVCKEPKEAANDDNVTAYIEMGVRVHDMLRQYDKRYDDPDYVSPTHE